MTLSQATKVHTFNPNTWKTEKVDLCLKPVWSTQQFPGQQGLHIKTLSQSQKIQQIGVERKSQGW